MTNFLTPSGSIPRAIPRAIPSSGGLFDPSKYAIVYNDSIITPTWRNGGFETAGAGGADVFAEWTEGVAGASTITAETTIVHTAGGKSCKFSVNSSDTCNIRQVILTVGKAYKLSFWARSADGTTTTILGYIGGQNQSFNLTDAWTQYSMTAIADTTTLNITRASAIGVKVSYIDDVVVEEVGVWHGNIVALDTNSGVPAVERTNLLTANLADCGDTSNNTTGFDITHIGVVKAVDATEYHQGAKSFKITTPDVGRGVYLSGSYRPTRTAGAVLTLSGWLKSANGNVVRTQVSQSGGAATFVDNVCTGDWQKFSVTHVCSIDEGVAIFILLQNTAGDFWIDELMLNDGLEKAWDNSPAIPAIPVTPLPDLSGFGNTGAVTGAIPVRLTSGEIAYSFDGVDDVVTVTGDKIGTGDATVEAWIYPTGWGEGGYGRIFDNTKLTLAIQNASCWITSDQSTTLDGTASSLALNTWYHVVATRTYAGVATIYINTEAKGAGASGTPTVGGNVLIGNNSAGDRTFAGNIAYPRIYNRILSPLEIRDNYNMDCATFGLSSK